MTSKLEQCAAASLRWADDNAVRFEVSKTEAILFSKRRKHRRREREIRVGTRRVRFNPGATRWLGIWLDSTLNLTENRKRRIGKTRQAEARLRRIVNQYGVPPAAARNLQAAIVQGTMLYASELTWSGGKEVEKEYQLAINRMGRASLGAFQSTPRGIVAAESGFTPARALLNHRRAGFVQRLYARPRGGQGPEEILSRENAALTTRAAAAIGRDGTAETQEWSAARRFPGRIIADERAAALQTASEWSRPDTVWTGRRQGGSGMRLEGS